MVQLLCALHEVSPGQAHPAALANGPCPFHVDANCSGLLLANLVHYHLAAPLSPQLILPATFLMDPGPVAATMAQLAAALTSQKHAQSKMPIHFLFQSESAKQKVPGRLPALERLNIASLFLHKTEVDPLETHLNINC